MSVMKNGKYKLATTAPLYPALGWHPAGTFDPREYEGHATAAQLLM